MPTPLQKAYGPEACHRCDKPLDSELPCIDDALNEYDHHLDEPEGAGHPNYDAPTFAELNAEERFYVMNDGWIR